MHVTTRSGLRRRIGGAALAVATAAALVGLPGTAYADETAPPAPATESPAPAEPAPAEPAPADPAPTDPAPADPAPTDPAPEDPAPADPVPAGPAAPAPADAPSKDAGPTAVPRLAAAVGTADLSVTIKGTTVAAGAPGKLAQVVVVNDGPARAEDVELELTFTPVAGANRVEYLSDPNLCDSTATPNVYRCVLGEIASGETFEFPVGVEPVSGAAATTDAGSLRAEATSTTTDPDTTDNTATGTFQIAGNGQDIVLMAFDSEVVPGQAGPVLGLVGNFGDRRSAPVAVDFTLPAGVRVPAEFVDDSGCAVTADRRSLTCVAPSIPVGEFTGFVLPVEVAENAGLGRVFAGGTAVASDASSMSLRSASRPRTSNIFEPATDAQAAAVAGDVDSSDNSDTFAVLTTERSADLSVAVPTVEAAKGSTVAVRYTVRNDGPDSVEFPGVLVTAPTGTEFGSLPDECEPAESRDAMWCFVPETLGVRQTATQTVSLRVTGTTVGTDGSLVVSSSEEWDPARADNTARIVVETPAAPLTQGRLPVTGTTLGLVGSAGLLMLLSGAALALGARRRRTA